MNINFDEIYHFMFETFEGVIILICSSLVICIIACIIMEFRTKKFLKARQEARAKAQKEKEEAETEEEEDETEEKAEEKEDE